MPWDQTVSTAKPESSHHVGTAQTALPRSVQVRSSHDPGESFQFSHLHRPQGKQGVSQTWICCHCCARVRAPNTETLLVDTASVYNQGTPMTSLTPRTEDRPLRKWLPTRASSREPSFCTISPRGCRTGQVCTTPHRREGQSKPAPQAEKEPGAITWVSRALRPLTSSGLAGQPTSSPLIPRSPAALPEQAGGPCEGVLAQSQGCSTLRHCTAREPELHFL